MIPKTYAYIIRQTANDRQLLVFRHRDYPEAGVQVPGGSVDAGETLEAAVLREVEEESGLTNLRIVRQLQTHEVYSEAHAEWQRRHYFELQLVGDCPETWIHTVSAGDRDKDLVFIYEWWPLERAIRELAGGKGEALKEVLV